MQKLNFKTTEAKAINAEVFLLRYWSSYRFCEKSADCYESKIMTHEKREEEGGSAVTDSVWQGPAPDQHDVQLRVAARVSARLARELYPCAWCSVKGCKQYKSVV